MIFGSNASWPCNKVRSEYKDDSKALGMFYFVTFHSCYLEPFPHFVNRLHIPVGHGALEELRSSTHSGVSVRGIEDST